MGYVMLVVLAVFIGYNVYALIRDIKEKKKNKIGAVEEREKEKRKKD